MLAKPNLAVHVGYHRLAGHLTAGRHTAAPAHPGFIARGCRRITREAQYLTTSCLSVLLCRTVTYSSYRDPFLVRAYPRETQEMVFDAHDRAFRLFGGMCRRGIYDNMATAVEAVFVGKDRGLPSLRAPRTVVVKTGRRPPPETAWSCPRSADRTRAGGVPPPQLRPAHRKHARGLAW
jgi:hypothetical protein